MQQPDSQVVARTGREAPFFLPRRIAAFVLGVDFTETLTGLDLAMMNRLRSGVLAVCAAALISCFVVPSTPTPVAPAPVGVSPEQLWRAPDARKGQRVQCYILAGDYKLGPAAIHWFDGNPTAPPAIVFECAVLPPDNTETLLLVGRCAGFVDGRALVTECEAKIIPRR